MEESHFKTQYNEHGQKLLDEIFNWFVNKTLPDVVLHVENRPIVAHKLILGASSTFFKSIFCTRESKDFYFDDISYRTMKAIVEYMYTGELVVEWELMPECLKLADCLMIRGLSKLYCDRVVTEPALVSQEMMEAIAAIGEAKPCATTQANEESMQESWRKQLNLPKLQLKRDARTGNWISKHDLNVDHNGNTKTKPTAKRKSTERDSKQTKGPKANNSAEDFKKTAKEDVLSQDGLTQFHQETKGIYNASASVQSLISEQELSSQTPISNDEFGFTHQFFNITPENDQNVCMTESLSNADYFLNENSQHFTLTAQELPIYNDIAQTNEQQEYEYTYSMQNKNTSTTPLTQAPKNSNSGQTNKKQTSELNGKIPVSQKHIKMDRMTEKELLVNRTKQQGTPPKASEKKAGNVRRNKQKQKTATTPPTSTASKATDLLIKKLFYERKNKRSPTAKQTNSSKSPKKANSTSAPANLNNVEKATSPTKVKPEKLCQPKEESKDENGKDLKTDLNESNNMKQLNRLANRCKVSDWHIDESEVLECDEEYEQHKNAPCPQPAEFLKTEKLVYGCPSCNKAYTLKSNYRRHYVVTHRRQDMPVYKCPICDSRFTRTDNRNSHIRKIHDFADPLAVQAWNQPFYMCALCKKGFYNDNDLQNHLKTVHPPTRNAYFGRIA